MVQHYSPQRGREAHVPFPKVFDDESDANTTRLLCCLLGQGPSHRDSDRECELAAWLDGGVQGFLAEAEP